MTPEAARHLEKARECLANARTSLGVNLSNDAGRGAYLAVFHSAQAFICERAGKFTKTHQNVQREFHRLARDEPRMDQNFRAS
jgi:uncharacterized protein (UPF0332 family)